MIDGGYILQPRIIDESEVSNMPPVTRELWFYLLRRVNHADYKKLKRGQGYFRLKDIQEELSWLVGFRKEKYSISQLSKSLRRLREGNMIETMKATHGIVVTVCKYDYYQTPGNYQGNKEGNMKAIGEHGYKQEEEKGTNKTLIEIQQDFIDQLTPFKAEFGEIMNEFYDYWSEPNKAGTKIKWQLEKTWDTKRRLQRWLKNRRVYQKNSQRPGQILKNNDENKSKKIISDAGF